MSSLRRRQWKSRGSQRALLEYKSLKYICPEGIYISITPDSFSVWNGVFFVRKGPYASAVLRFRINIPLRYPCVPPFVVLISDVFHPLVTPSTISSYAPSSLEPDPSTTSDQKRLPSGGFSLRHGFPAWLRYSDQSGMPSLVEESPKSYLDITGGSECDSDEHSTIVLRQKPMKESTALDHIAGNGLQMSVNDTVVPSIVDVLHYMKQSFEDEPLLDSVMLDEACNEGAWHAWRAHRAHKSVVSRNGNQEDVQANSSLCRNEIKPLSDWNWEGVWEKRVKAIIDASISDQALFVSGDNDDPIQFLDLNKENHRTTQ